MPLITAALAPILTLAKAIPVFESQKTSLATFCGLFGFLLVAWVFYARGIFVPAMTGSLSRAIGSGDYKPDWYETLSRILSHQGVGMMITCAPLALILLSADCYLSYSQKLDGALDQIQISVSKSAGTSSQAEPSPRKQGRQDLLGTWGADQSIPGAGWLQIEYLGIFLCAELAFVLMGLREYAYGTLQISEREVLSGLREARTFGAPAQHEALTSLPVPTDPINDRSVSP
ncbi:hypothetical protein [Acidicapsa acidisoli]|uniref:hypothetical protein n=1 Tax=Acidicapsa acidisoli TaxID=1615681 RepID=UPI0021DFB75A|nr:hypothetical protein [Acidicapsa acidisoli]